MDYHIAWDVDEDKKPVGKEEEVALVQKFGGLPRDKIQDVVKNLVKLSSLFYFTILETRY